MHSNLVVFFYVSEGNIALSPITVNLKKLYITFPITFPKQSSVIVL